MKVRPIIFEPEDRKSLRFLFNKVAAERMSLGDKTSAPYFKGLADVLDESIATGNQVNFIFAPTKERYEKLKDEVTPGCHVVDPNEETKYTPGPPTSEGCCAECKHLVDNREKRLCSENVFRMRYDQAPLMEGNNWIDLSKMNCALWEKKEESDGTYKK